LFNILKASLHLIVSIIVFFSLSTNQIFAQGTDSKTQRAQPGWSIAALPNLSFDSDVGFRYGVLANVFYSGSRTSNKENFHSLSFEWSRTVKGSGINRLYFDSNYIIPSIDFDIDISYLTDLEMQFFGFNGYEAVYNAKWEDRSSSDYVSEVFYRHDRKVFRIISNFQGRLFNSNDHIRWTAGLVYNNIEVGSVDLNRINEKKSEEEQLPEAEGLYDKYVKWGVIKNYHARGDKITYLKGGLIYDTRDQKKFPTKGIFTDAILAYAPSLPGDGQLDYARATFFFRHYLSLDSRNLVFAYRVGYQGTLFGEVPFFMQPQIVNSKMESASFQGLGGSKTLRGVMRNRVVGDGIFIGNAELRWIFLRTMAFNQEIYLGGNLFSDFGKVVDKIEFTIDESEVGPEDILDDYFETNSERFHITAGAGLKIGIKERLIVSCDYGVTMDDRDGNSGLYITLNWLY
jgi:outer membrane protein assembly factor BamA